jgi:hypothetical protein
MSLEEDDKKDINNNENINIIEKITDKEKLKRRNRYYYLKRINGDIKNFSMNSKYDIDIINFLTNKEKLTKSNLFKNYQ